MYDVKLLTESIKRLTNVGIALSATKDINEFFELILNEAMFFTNADAGTIYMISDNQRFLDFKIVCTKSKGIHLGIADTFHWPSVPLYCADGSMNMTNFVSFVTHTGIARKIDDVHNQELFDASGTRKYDKANEYRSVSMAAIPLKNYENDVLGVIQLINAMDNDGQIIPFAKRNIVFLDSLASQAAIALSNKKLISNLESLLNQFIESIAKAIDKKSKHTGGHITRVTTLSELLIRKVDEDEKYYPDLNFSADDMQELRLSAWMHDVGKITTPVYIQDKKTKLETIFDRIDLILERMDKVCAIIERDKLTTEAKKQVELSNLINKITGYKELIRKANISSEFTDNETIEKIKEVYAFEYFSQGKTYNLLSHDEFHNLCIRKGTLTTEEMAKMHEHATVTLEMLQELSFPKKFRNVPLFASSHHEKLNGNGYPSRLNEAELPIQARIIAIADIFEALTACDRPYKKDKKLSETFKILAFMAKSHDIDPTLLDLFLDSGLYLEYAKMYLKSEQIDEVDNETIKQMYHS
jgi:HD-GYP domain-containing protein (c-di-GMP phosphodiesterase class II)